MFSHFLLLQCLLEHGADPNCVDDQGRTVLVTIFDGQCFTDAEQRKQVVSLLFQRFILCARNSGTASVERCPKFGHRPRDSHCPKFGHNPTGWMDFAFQ